MIEMRNGSDDVLKQHIWGTRYVDELLQIGINDDPTDAGEDDCETFYWALQDANYNVLGIVESDGDLAERYEYTPYSRRTIYKSAGSDDVHCHAPIMESQRAVSGYPHGICGIGHQGLMHDKEFGLIYNRARYLHPVLGRFTSRDPLGYVDGMSLYEYVRGNPVVLKDGSGLTQEQRAAWRQRIRAREKWIRGGNPDAAYHRETNRLLAEAIKYNQWQESQWDEGRRGETQEYNYERDMALRRQLQRRGVIAKGIVSSHDLWKQLARAAMRGAPEEEQARMRRGWLRLQKPGRTFVLVICSGVWRHGSHIGTHCEVVACCDGKCSRLGDTGNDEKRPRTLEYESERRNPGPADLLESAISDTASWSFWEVKRVSGEERVCEGYKCLVKAVKTAKFPPYPSYPGDYFSGTDVNSNTFAHALLKKCCYEVKQYIYWKTVAMSPGGHSYPVKTRTPNYDSLHAWNHNHDYWKEEK